MESSCLTVFEADPVTVEVSLELLLFEVPDEDLRGALSPYGAIHDVRLQKYADSDIHAATRMLTMSLACHIPVNLRALRYPCRVFYRGQPRPCPICRSDGHRASSAICVLSVDAAFSLGILPGTVNLPRLNLTHPLFRMMFLLLMMMIICSLKSLCLKSLLMVMREVWRLLLPLLIPAVPFSSSVFFVCRQVLTRSLQRLLLSHLLLLLFRRMCLRMCPRMTLLPESSVVLRVFQLPFFNGFCVSLTNFPCHPGNLLNV